MGSITEQDDIPTYAPSLQVPSVQEMVVKDPRQVPERYIRGEEGMQTELYMSHLSSEVPVIDLSLLSKGNKDELTKLDLDCKEWGFFQVVNHGVAREAWQGMKDASVEFFELPLEEKNKISMPPDDIQGYMAMHMWYLKIKEIVYNNKNETAMELKSAELEQNEV